MTDQPDPIRDAAAPATVVITAAMRDRLPVHVVDAIDAGRARLVAIDDDGIHTVPIDPR